MSENAFLSFSATKDISGNSSPEFPSTITSWFLLESDVRGPVEDPSYYFDSSNADRLKDLDLLLLTQGWRDFKWKYENPYFKPETGFTISGRLRKKFADVPLQNARVNIAIFKKGNPLITTVPADSTGRFNLEDIDFNGDAKLVASITGDKNSLKGWLLLDSAGYSPAMVNESMVAANSVRINVHFISDNNRFSDNQIIKKNLPTYIQYAEISSSIQKKYKLSDTISLGAVTIIAKRQDKPESARVRSQQYLMALFPDDEYVVSPKSEAYRTLGHLISVKLHMNSGNMSGLAFNNPLILLDGLEVGWEGIMDLPVEWIERFDGLKPGSAAAAAWGEKGRGGVISVITRTGALLDNETPVYHSANTRISGYNEPRIFYSPKHHSKLETDYKPDLRTTIFWEPNVKLENSKDLFLNYFNADNPSKVKVVVEGITTTGVPVTGQAEYEVK
jgi:hypothetical protein